MSGPFLLAALAGSCAAAFSFARPQGKFRLSAILLAAAIPVPLALGFLLDPFVSDAAGMGLVFILAALAALIGVVAISTAFGAGARHLWNAIRRAG